VSDARGDFDFVRFSHYVAEELERQGWLAQARQTDEQVPWLEDARQENDCK